MTLASLIRVASLKNWQDLMIPHGIYKDLTSLKDLVRFTDSVKDSQVFDDVLKCLVSLQILCPYGFDALHSLSRLLRSTGRARQARPTRSTRLLVNSLTRQLSNSASIP